MNSVKKYKLAILTSHPIQYQAPLFRLLAKQPEIDLIVYFCWDFGVKEGSFDAQFGKKIKWDIPLLDGYQYKFLKNYSPKPSSNFWGQVNFGIIKKLILRTPDVPSIDDNFRTSDVRKLKYDAVLVFGWNSFTNWLAFLTAFILKIPVFLRGENPLNQELLKPQWKIKIKKIILGWLFKYISAFLYIGEENKKFYKFYGVPEEKLFFAPYAVDNERFIKEGKSQIAKQKALREKFGISEKDVVILFVGKLIEKKRPMDLLLAYELLIKSQKPKVKSSLLFVGDGALRPELEKYVKEHNLQNVHFIGFKNQTELPQYYAMADIFVLPSGIGETWGLVVDEAMCFSLPVIVSDLVGCGADLVKNGENGYIFKTGNIEELVSYLLELINPLDLNSSYSDKLVDSGYGIKKRESFGKKSFEIIQKYGYENNIKGISEAFNRIKNEN